MSKLFTMYVGTERDRDGKPIANLEGEFAITVLKRELAERFGGYSVGKVRGGYLGTLTNAVVEEQALRIEITANDSQVAQIHEVAVMFRDLFKQESVLVNCSTIDSEYV